MVGGFRLTLFRTAATLLIANLKGFSRIKRPLKQEGKFVPPLLRRISRRQRSARRYKVCAQNFINVKFGFMMPDRSNLNSFSPQNAPGLAVTGQKAKKREREEEGGKEEGDCAKWLVYGPEVWSRSLERGTLIRGFVKWLLLRIATIRIDDKRNAHRSGFILAIFSIRAVLTSKNG